MNNIEKIEILLDSVFLGGKDYEDLVGKYFAMNESQVNNSELRNKLSSGQSLFADTTKIVDVN